MSTRTFFIPISSIEALRAIVGSQDQQLETWLLDNLKARAKKAYGTTVLENMDPWDREDYEHSLAAVKNILAGKCKVEPGSWVGELCLILEKRKLQLKVKLPFTNHDWKHAWIWDDYIDHVKTLAGKSTTKLLRSLEAGRPLKGKSVEYDGCTFAWLALPEIQPMHDALERIEVAEDLARFHQQVVDTLAVCCKKQCDLFMGAS